MGRRAFRELSLKGLSLTEKREKRRAFRESQKDQKKLETVESGKEKNGVESGKEEEKKDARLIPTDLTPNDEDMKEDDKMAAVAKKGSDNDAEFEEPEEQIKNKNYDEDDDEDMGVLVPRDAMAGGGKGESAANKQKE